MLKTRIIPILLYDGEYCVKTTQFNRPVRRLGPIDQYVLNMANRDIDELIILDILATEQRREPDFSQIKKFTEKLHCPVTYGGGVKNIDHIKKLIQECGIDKVVIKTHIGILEEAIKKLGSQSVVCALDCKNNISPYAHRLNARVLEDIGAGELVVTDIDVQGTMNGYNLGLIGEIADNIKLPLIANGGCGSINHMIEAIKAGANAVAASTVFAFTGLTPRMAAEGLHAAGIPVRLDPKDARPRPREPSGEGV